MTLPRKSLSAVSCSLAFAPVYVPVPDGGLAWPVLRAGFIGQASPAGDRRALDVSMPRGAGGGPVFDASFPE